MRHMAAAPTDGSGASLGDEVEVTEVRRVTLAGVDEPLPGMREPVREPWRASSTRWHKRERKG